MESLAILHVGKGGGGRGVLALGREGGEERDVPRWQLVQLTDGKRERGDGQEVDVCKLRKGEARQAVK